MTMYEKPINIVKRFWKLLAADTDLVCRLCHHFQQLSAQGITGKIPGCLLKALCNRCKTGTDGNVAEQTMELSALLPEVLDQR